jgi:hypothetical protein
MCGDGYDQVEYRSMYTGLPGGEDAAYTDNSETGPSLSMDIWVSNWHCQLRFWPDIRSRSGFPTARVSPAERQY